MATFTQYLNSQQIPDKAMQDQFNRQAYLGNSFVYQYGATAVSGTSEVPILLIKNAQTITNSRSVFVNLRRCINLTASQTAIFRFYLNPTVSSAGTPAVAINLRPAVGTSSIATLTTAPTISANGSLIGMLATTDYGGMADNTMLAVLDNSKSHLITVQVSQDADPVAITLGWYEV